MPRRPARARLLCSFEILLALTVLGLLLGLLLLTQPTPAHAFGSNWYVNLGGNDGNTCFDVAHACRTITMALNKASSFDLIHVGVGTYTENLTITKNIYIIGSGTSATIIDGNAAGHVVNTFGSTAVWLSALTVRNGYMNSSAFGDEGGGIRNFGTLTLINVDVVSNTANFVPGSCSSYCGGGGIYNSGTLSMTNGTVGWNHSPGGAGIANIGTMDLSGVVIANNTGMGDSSGGGLYSALGHVTLNNVTVRNNDAVNGGGIRNSSLMTVTNSTINHNTAVGNAGIWNQGSGAVMTMTNATVSSNNAANYAGVANTNSAVLTLNNVTIAANQAQYYAPGIYVGTGSTLEMYNSLLSSPGADCTVDGTAISRGYNLISDASCSSVFNATGDITNTNPGIAPLSNWGGTTQTHGLMPGSPALNAGNPGSPYACTATDQRGVARPVGVRCDIGAFEGVLNAVMLPLIYRH